MTELVEWGKWIDVGGKVELNESVFQGAIRSGTKFEITLVTCPCRGYFMFKIPSDVRELYEESGDVADERNLLHREINNEFHY